MVALKDNNISAEADKDSNTLNIAGISYIIGDIALWAAGEFGGAWWLAGGLAAARYGHPKAEKQYELLCDRLGNHLRKQGVEIPTNPDAAALRRKGGVVDQLEAFAYTYPSQILNTAYTIGSVLLIKSGLFPKAGKDVSYARAGAGALVIAGALGGLLIKEKKPDPDHPAKTVLGKAWEKVQAQPLIWPAVAYGLNDVLLAKDAWNDLRKAKGLNRQSLKWLTVATYAVGNVMLALSKKDNSESAANIKAMEQVANTAALVVAAQATEVQEALVQQMAGYLAAQPETKLKANEIADLMHKKLAEVAKIAAEAKANNEMQPSPETKNWQSRNYKSSDLQPAPSL